MKIVGEATESWGMESAPPGWYGVNQSEPGWAMARPARPSPTPLRF